MTDNATIITHHIRPPVPSEAFDWVAYFSFDEESQYLTGFGHTEDAAVLDLLCQAYEEDDEYYREAALAAFIARTPSDPTYSHNDEALMRAAKAIHDGPLMADDYDFYGGGKHATSAREWCIDVAKAARAELTKLPNEDDLDARMEEAGMIPLSKMLSSPPTKFSVHKSVKTVDDLYWWVESKHKEFLTMRMQYELGDEAKDDLFEWVFAHYSVFSALHDHMRASIGVPPVPYPLKEPDNEG